MRGHVSSPVACQLAYEQSAPSNGSSYWPSYWSVCRSDRLLILPVGLIAFYTVFVLGIGRMLRGIFGGTRYRLILDELPRTRDLVDLCEVISS